MTELSHIRTTPMPDDMRRLLNAYPREAWEAHPNFKDATRRWLGAHQIFRQLGELIRADAELYLDGQRETQEYAGRLAYYGNALVRNLHGHHGWEDHRYFPELSEADPRFDAGLEILEKDHHDLDQVLDGFTKSANRTIKLSQLDEAAMYEEAGAVHAHAETIEAFLARHLGDEEDLAVPIILHHKLRG
ncbi:hemerythrin domain-containing protein [Shimia sp. R9_2]|uniref:hemerythrin domain-containing protein n=1 Tax=Shimia sp. R9_2 TaxID=2821112 RepID=UPI001FFE1891|nr:hemerythrin domain-containing protein [Shimia sp. R9_2]